jgi:hypothetical protein
VSEKDKNRVLVTRAAGFIGSAVVGDLAPDTDWREELQGCQAPSVRMAVVQCAARVHVMDDGATDPLADYRRANVEGTLILARQGAEAGIHHRADCRAASDLSSAWFEVMTRYILFPYLYAGSMSMAKQAVFTMKLEPELREAFMAEAEADHRPASQVLRELMRDYIQRQREAREYEAFLSNKVEKARCSMRGGEGRSNAEVEALFSARRSQAESLL